jgi:hypothetical protein
VKNWGKEIGGENEREDELMMRRVTESDKPD